MNIGEQVTWKNQAKGKHKQLTGTIINFIESGENSFNKLLSVDKLSMSRIQFEKGERSYRRVLVEVERGGKSTLSDFYAPNIASLKVVPAGA